MSLAEAPAHSTVRSQFGALAIGFAGTAIAYSVIQFLSQQVNICVLFITYLDWLLDTFRDTLSYGLRPI